MFTFLIFKPINTLALTINSNNNFIVKDLLFYLIPLLLLIISLIIWYIYGKQDKPIETLEFYPPENLNSLEIWYIYKRRADDVDIIALLIYLASKGYIKIS